MAAEAPQFQPTTDRQVAEMYMHDHLDQIHPITPKILFEAHAHVYEVNMAEGWVNTTRSGTLQFGEYELLVGYSPNTITGGAFSYQDQLDPDGTERDYTFKKDGEIYTASEVDPNTQRVIVDLGDNQTDNETKFVLLHMLYIAFTRSPEQQVDATPTPQDPELSIQFPAHMQPTE